MKNIIILTCFLITIYGFDQTTADEPVQSITEIALECMEKVKPPEVDMQNMLDKKPPTTHEGKCVIGCVLKKVHALNEDGTYGSPNLDFLKATESNDPDLNGKLEKIWNTCKGKITIKPDSCETAYELILCGHDESLKAGIELLF